MQRFNTSGVGLKPDSIRACIIYDAHSGQIRHLHTVVTFGGVKPKSQDEVESEALSMARESGEDLNNTKILHVDQAELKPHVRYRVDLKTQSLIEDVDMLEAVVRQRRESKPHG